MKRNTLIFILILVIFSFALWTILPINGERLGREGMHLGLDLVGGVHLVYEAQFEEGATGEEKAADMERAIDTIKRRIDKYGVTEPIIQQLGSNRILVQLPGFTDIEAAKGLVEQTGFLEFRRIELDKDGNPVSLSDYLEDSRTEFFNESETDSRLFVNYDNNPIAFLKKGDNGLEFVDENGNPVTIDTEELGIDPGYVWAWIPAQGNDGTYLTGDLLADAYATVSQSDITDPYKVIVKWNSQGSEIFDQLAKQLYNPQQGIILPECMLGIFVDNVLVSDPQVRASSFGGEATISGGFTQERALELGTLLKSGALPMPLKKPPLYQEKVDSTLGANFVGMAVKAGIIGIILVMLFMIAYYRMSGLLASLALVFYGVLVLAIFKMWPVTLTLAGLGGFILSIGMAVDANVLIFERMKEELRAGRTLGAAIEGGFNRAWSGIRDSNITTFIVCIILIIVGNNIIGGAPVMGFGWTLLIGVAVSMFTAIVVTRTMLRLFVGSNLAKKTFLFSSERVKK